MWRDIESQEEAEQQVMGKASSPATFPTQFQDRPEDFPAQPRRWSISSTNRHTVALVRHLLVPPSIRQAFPSIQRQSPLPGPVDLLPLRLSSALSPRDTPETAN